MYFIDTLLKLKKNLFIQLSLGSGFLSAFLFLLCCVVLSIAVWWVGPCLTWGHTLPLLPKENRIAVIIAIGVLWLCKFLMVDLDVVLPLYRYKDKTLRNDIRILKKRFLSAIYFLKKTIISKQEKHIHLIHLPWYLLIGPANAGKTTLLLNAKANFILQRQFRHADQQSLSPTQNCEWWITKEQTILDIPGRYLFESGEESKAAIHQSNVHRILWHTLLRLMKRQRRTKNGINGLLIALPLPEMLLQHDVKYYEGLLYCLIRQIREIQYTFQQKLPCYLLITKCDLLPGFSEFFSECGSDEIMQAWGVPLTPFSKVAFPKDKKVHDIFLARCNELIKRLNQQLLWRLHQEHHYITRSYIKDFPLQMERLKDFTFDFIKQLSMLSPTLAWQGVYFSSAIQPPPETEAVILSDGTLNTSQANMQIFQAPPLLSRPYFIKHVITQVITQRCTIGDHDWSPTRQKWQRAAIYVSILSAMSAAGVVIGIDFKQGLYQLYAMQDDLTHYQKTVQTLDVTRDRLKQAILLLNALHDLPHEQTMTYHIFNVDVGNMLSFYSDRAQKTAQALYYETLQMVLMPEVKNVLEDYLSNASHKNINLVYASLKTYLMLGDVRRLQSDYVVSTLGRLLSKKLGQEFFVSLKNHLLIALNQYRRPMLLNTAMIEYARNFLNSKSNVVLGRTILNNLTYYSQNKALNMETYVHYPLVLKQTRASQIPYQFTADSFVDIMTHKIASAAKAVVIGNWVLGHDRELNNNPELVKALITQLRLEYAKQYAHYWQRFINEIELSKPSDLAQADKFIVRLISSASPLLKILQAIHHHIYFAPVIAANPTLQHVNALVAVDHSPEENLLYQVFSNFQTIHQRLQTVLIAKDSKKVALHWVLERAQSQQTLDVLTQLRLIADKTPSPINAWFINIADTVWRNLVEDAVRYLDTLWKQNVIIAYKSDIADRYPFSVSSTEEVDLQKFIKFFGYQGLFMKFYRQYFQGLIDQSKPTWRWKSIDGFTLPLSEQVLQQLQAAVNINKAFFPHRNNRLNLNFVLTPYKISDIFKKIQLRINKKLIVHDKESMPSHVIFNWPGKGDENAASMHLMTTHNDSFQHDFIGNWGLFKLVNQSMNNVVDHNKVIINLSMSKQPAQYVLLTKNLYNPFALLNLQRFHLSNQLVV